MFYKRLGEGKEAVICLNIISYFQMAYIEEKLNN